jgi:N-acetylmuramoyl-L-alanine amidase
MPIDTERDKGAGGTVSGTGDQPAVPSRQLPESTDVAVTGEIIILPEQVEKKPEVVPEESQAEEISIKEKVVTTAEVTSGQMPRTSDSPTSNSSGNMVDDTSEGGAVEVLARADGTPSPEETSSAPSPADARNETSIEFRVQLLAISQDLPLRAENFKGLGKLSKEPVRNLFRYMYGSTPSFSEAKLLEANAQKKGYTTAYVVAYMDGKRIPVPKALKYLSE